MGKRNQLSITLQWGYNNSIVGEETFIDKIGRRSGDFISYYKNDLFDPWDEKPYHQKYQITGNGWAKKLQPYFKHVINEKAFTYTIVLIDKEIDVEGELRIKNLSERNPDFYTIVQWWNKESREGGVEVLKNNPVFQRLDWHNKKYQYPKRSESERQGIFPLFDHRDQTPGHPQEFFIERLKEMLGDRVGDMPISNDNYYIIRYLPWSEQSSRLTLVWGRKDAPLVTTELQETQFVKGWDTSSVANVVAISYPIGLPPDEFWVPGVPIDEECVERAYEIVKFNHKPDFDKYRYGFIFTRTLECFA